MKTAQQAFDIALSRIAAEEGLPPLADEAERGIARKLFNAGADWRRDRDVYLCNEKAQTFTSNADRRLAAGDCAYTIQRTPDAKDS